MEPIRCYGDQPGAMRDYHDTEWGVPVRDEAKMFEFLTLESAQAGLSWATILNRREGYRKCFAGFDAEKVARFTDADVERLMQDVSIIRNRAKINAAIHNAQLVLELREAGGGLAQFMWDFVDNVPLQPRLQESDEWPAITPVAERMSREMKRMGFKFFGPTICYAHMQAAGLTNDHKVTCFRHEEVARLGGAK